MYLRTYGKVIAFALFALVTITDATASAGLVDGIWFSDNSIINSHDTVIYAVLHNQTKLPLTGMATLTVDGDAVSASKVDVSADAVKRISLSYQFTSGEHIVAVTFTPSNGVDITEGELARRHITVLQDTDMDGIADIYDTHNDNRNTEDSKKSNNLVSEMLPQKINTEMSGVLNSINGITRKYIPHTESTDGNQKTHNVNTEDIQTATKSLLATLEAFRKERAASVATYEAQHRATLAQIEKEEASKAGGFTKPPTVAQQSDKREQQIATVGASVLGFTLNKKIIFYTEVLVLVLGVLHILWVWIKSLLRGREEEEVEEWEEE